MLQLSDNMRGAVFMMVCMAAFVLNDALTKTVADELTVFQAMFLRGLVATVLIGAVAARRGVLLYRIAREDFRPLGLRLIGAVGSTVCFLNALFHMPLPNVSAISQSMPLAMTLGAALFLAEPVGWRRYLAIGIGFSGVLIIVRPGAEGFNEASLWAIASVGFATLRDLATRRMSRGMPSLFVALTNAVAVAVVGGAVAAFQPWQDVSATSFGILALAALFLFAGYMFNVMSMRHGEIGFVAPFRYTVLIWALLIGALAFGEIPDSQTLLGAAIVVGTGIYTFYREERLRRRALRRPGGLASGKMPV